MRVQLVHYEDWVQLFVGPDLRYEGHSIPDHEWLDFISSLKKHQLPIRIENSIDFSPYGLYFAYHDTPKTAYDLEKEYAFVKNMERKGYVLNEDGDWVKE